MPLHARKVPLVTLAFWVVKIAATTLGETGGDAVSMSLDLGYAVSTIIFAAIFLGLLAAQVNAVSYRPFLYWGVIVATTTVGTTLSDYLDRSVGLGYPLSSALLFTAVIATLLIWRRTTGSISVANISARRDEIFYWVTILLSNTLGTALGDFAADSSGLGFDGGALLFGAMLALIAMAYFLTMVSHTILFWAAFVLTRPLGATLGDLLTKPLEDGGLDLSRFVSSLVLAVFMIIVIVIDNRRTEKGTS